MAEDLEEILTETPEATSGLAGLGLSDKILGTLTDQNFSTVEELLEMVRADTLGQVKGIGKKTAELIKIALIESGYDTDPPEPHDRFAEPEYAPSVENVPAWQRTERIDGNGKLMPAKLYKVEVTQGPAKYPIDTLRAVDAGEAWCSFVIKHGVRGPTRYRRRITPVDESDGNE